MTEQLATYDVAQELALPDKAYLQRELIAVREFQALVREFLIPGQDYGVIPGTQKPTLLKPGGEKIAKLLGLADLYQIDREIEDWGRPLFAYRVRCQLVSVRTGKVVSESFGEANSMEARYRWREDKRLCPQCSQATIIKGKEEFGGGWLCHKKQGGCGAKWPDGAAAIESQKVGRVENDDVFSLVNTLIKMAQKRALIGASLSAGRLSEVFTQDMEDPAPHDVVEGEYSVVDEPDATPPRAAATTTDKLPCPTCGAPEVINFRKGNLAGKWGHKTSDGKWHVFDRKPGPRPETGVVDHETGEIVKETSKEDPARHSESPMETVDQDTGEVIGEQPPETLIQQFNSLALNKWGAAWRTESRAWLAEHFKGAHDLKLLDEDEQIIAVALLR